MQYARCVDDGQVWEASRFAELPANEFEVKRRNLVCEQCDEFAWFRKESTHGHPAHFCAHHKDDCELRINYVLVDPRDDATLAEGEVGAGDDIIVHLDREKGSQVEIVEVQPPATPGQGTGGRSFVVPGTDRLSAQHFTLRRILLRLIQSPDFRNSNRQIVLYRKENDVLIRGAIKEVATSFAEIKNTHNDRFMLFWGPIATAGRTADGKVWLNSSERNQGTSVAVFEDIAREFLRIFKVEDLSEFEGAHVLVAAKCYVASTGKIVLWCSSPQSIVVRRYRDNKLQAVL